MSIELQTEPEVSIIPKNLSERDKAIIYTLVKEKALVKFQEKYISDMKMKNQELQGLIKNYKKKFVLILNIFQEKMLHCLLGYMNHS